MLEIPREPRCGRRDEPATMTQFDYEPILLQELRGTLTQNLNAKRKTITLVRDFVDLLEPDTRIERI